MPEKESRAAAGELALDGLQHLVSRLSQGPADRFGRVPLFRILVQANQRDGRWALPIEVIIGHQGSVPALQVLGWTHAATSRHTS